ncbi:MAG: hypothetical protein D6730_10960 [Bacteroidetes bacterium]|nr:MAG: hypothetical protein D6730_10960 [Bacteroidota bacterium]
MKQIVLPEENLNKLAQKVSDNLIQGHYFNQGVIRGDELKDFAEHTQINKFLLFQVYQVWNMQISKLKHPYFDFEHPEIKEHLQLLRNLLSQHIAISQQDFRPMLKRAVYNNLKLLLDPKETFTSFFFANREKTPLELYERYTPFFSDFDFIVNSILHYHKKNHMDTVEKDIFFLKMEKVIEIFEQKSGQHFDDYRAGIFEKLTQHKLGDILEEVKREEEERKALEAEEARRRQEEAERLAREEQARREAELAEQKRREEEERQRKLLEEARRKSFFDNLEPPATFFDIEGEESVQTTDAPATEEAVTEQQESPQEEVAPPSDEAVTETEERLQVETEAPAAQQETVAETPQEETAAEEAGEASPEREVVVEEEVQEVKEVPIEETQAPAEETATEEPETIAEEIAETAADKAAETVEETAKEVPEKMEEVAEEVEEGAEEVQEMAQAEQEQQEEEPVVTTLADKLADQVQKKEPTILDRIAQKEEENNALLDEEDRPKTIAEKLAGEEAQTESTTSFLDRFLNRKKEEKKEVPAEQVKSIAEQLEQEKPKTVADRFQESSGPKLHEALNGDNKIKLNEIPIHKQYQFVQKVFDGNNVRFRIIVDKVNNAKDKAEVEDILQKFVLSKEDIDQNDGAVREFIDLLRNRF